MVYLDYNATSPIHPEVRRAMAPFLDELFGNASSLHAKGREARSAIEKVRAQILAALGDPGGQLVFTSGGTEADNLALKGVVGALKGEKDRVILSSVEHHAVLHAAYALAEEGIEVTLIPVDSQGIVDLEALKRAITPRTALVSVMHANNEVGTLQPIEEIGRIAHAHGALFHTDAVQSFGKVPLDLHSMEVDLLCLSAHKLGGPKGIGALYLRRGIPLKTMIQGGPHEHQLRAGTEGVPGIVGMGAAVEVSLREQRNGTVDRIRHLRDRLEAGLKEQVPRVRVNGHPSQRVAGTLNVSFLGCKAETLLMALDLAGIAVSTGAACSSGSTEPSHVLVAMGLPAERMDGSIRFSLGWATTEEEIEQALRLIPPIGEQVRKSEGVRPLLLKTYANSSPKGV